jgi:hypothetical protein
MGERSLVKAEFLQLHPVKFPPVGAYKDEVNEQQADERDRHKLLP